MSENKQTDVPGRADKNRPLWQEDGSLNSTIIVSAGADVGVSGGMGIAPDSNSAGSGEEQNTHPRREQ